MSTRRAITNFCLVMGIVLLMLYGVASGPINHGYGFQYKGRLVTRVHEIGIAMYSYANDNGGQYPDGANSTEVFQKLIEGGYVTDSGVFYVPLRGKLEAAPGQKLKPENVCFDTTSGVNFKSPDGLPLVFMTGYQIAYVPGGEAVPLPLRPSFGDSSWIQMFLPRPNVELRPVSGIAVYYKNNAAAWVSPPAQRESSGAISYPPEYDPNARIPNVVPAGFPSGATVYKQLTPQGPLP